METAVCLTWTTEDKCKGHGQTCQTLAERTGWANQEHYALMYTGSGKDGFEASCDSLWVAYCGGFLFRQEIYQLLGGAKLLLIRTHLCERF